MTRSAMMLKQTSLPLIPAPTIAGNASDSVSLGRVLEHANEDDDGLSEEGGQPADEGEPSGCAGMVEPWLPRS